MTDRADEIARELTDYICRQDDLGEEAAFSDQYSPALAAAIRAYGDEIRSEVLEEAALLVDNSDGTVGGCPRCRWLAKDIRALKEKP